MLLVNSFFYAVEQKRQVDTTKLGRVFSLSDDLAVEPILSLIPFFSIGITGFATFSVSVVMSRIARPSLYAYAAVLTVFIAALLDLSQQLFRGASNVQAGLGLDAVRGFLDAREIFFALSFGLRFIFFWATVATGYGQQGAYNTSHFASWDRWGVFGALLKYSTLAGCFVVPVLQGLWRLGPNNVTFHSIYLADSTFQIVLSALFIMKVFLTFIIIPPQQRVPALIHYLLPLCSLAVSLTLGIIALISNTFSESTLGRFLQAIEMYMMLLFALFLSFQAKSKPRPRSSFQALGNIAGSEKRNIPDSFVALPPRVPTPDYLSQQADVRIEGRRRSSARMSSWFAPRPAPPAPNLTPKLSKRHDVELGMTLPSRPAPRFAIDVSVPRQIAAPVVRSPREWEDTPSVPPSPARSTRRTGGQRTPRAVTPTGQTLVIPPASRRSMVETPSPLLLPMQPLPPPSVPPEPLAVSEVKSKSLLSIPPASQSRPESSGSSFIEEALDLRKTATTTMDQSTRPVTDISLASYYRTDQNSPVASLQPPLSIREPGQADSPIYGLNGIIRGLPSEKPETLPGTPTRGSGSSFDQLLKEQQALDNSIRMLKLFSPRDTVMSTTSTEIPLEAPQAPALKSTETSKSGSGSERLTTQSNSTSTHRLESMSAQSEFSLSVFPDPPEVETISRARRVVVGPRSPLGQDQFSNTDSALGEPPGRLDSAITQYEITSFIANPHSDESRNTTLTKAEILQRSNVPPQALRPLLLNTSTAPEVQSVPYNAPRDPLKPLILGLGRGGRGPPPKISGPRPPRLEEGEPDIYERPRTPPQVF